MLTAGTLIVRALDTLQRETLFHARAGTEHYYSLGHVSMMAVIYMANMLQRSRRGHAPHAMMDDRRGSA